jgi:hypothetical protein
VSAHLNSGVTERFRNHLLDFSSLGRPMGCCSSKPVDEPSVTATTRREVTQRQSSPVTQLVVRAPERSSQHSRVNAGHEPPPVEQASVRERRRSKSTSHPPMGIGEDWPPQVPSHRTRAKSSSGRNPSTPSGAGEYYCCWSTYLSHRPS